MGPLEGKCTNNLKKDQ